MWQCWSEESIFSSCICGFYWKYFFFKFFIKIPTMSSLSQSGQVEIAPIFLNKSLNRVWGNIFENHSCSAESRWAGARREFDHNLSGESKVANIQIHRNHLQFSVTIVMSNHSNNVWLQLLHIFIIQFSTVSFCSPQLTLFICLVAVNVYRNITSTSACPTTNDITIGWQNLNPLSHPNGKTTATSKASKGQWWNFELLSVRWGASLTS